MSAPCKCGHSLESHTRRSRGSPGRCRAHFTGESKESCKCVQYEPQTPKLSKDGHALRNRIAEAGIELTPDQLAEGLAEAHERIGQHDGNHGCVRCHRQGQDLRFGVCFNCAMGKTPGATQAREL